uniref:hypothetical protein n=1 Tax=Bacteroides acidifaciens TaxID=85831 RepID=UPI00242A82AB
ISADRENFFFGGDFLVSPPVSTHGNERILSWKQEFPLMETKGNYTTLIIRYVDKHQPFFIKKKFR